MSNLDRVGTGLGCCFLVVAAVLLFQEGGIARNAIARRYGEWKSARMVDKHWDEMASAPTSIGKGFREVLVEFTDYTCPYCRMVHDSSTRLLRDDEGRRIIVRFFPRPGSALAQAAAVAGLCAGEQGRFAEFTAEMFSSDAWMQTREWDKVADAAGVPDGAAYRTCLTAGSTLARLAQDSVLGVAVGVAGTPAFVGRNSGLRIGVVPNDERATWFTPVR